MKTPKELFIAGLREGNKYAQCTFPDSIIEERLWQEILETEGIVQPTPPENKIPNANIEPEIVDMPRYWRTKFEGSRK